MTRLDTAALLAFAATVSACASVAVTDQSIADRTAFALGMDKSAFTISNRTDEGMTTRYAVKTKSGQDYNCYVDGSFGITGRVVTDAICVKKGEVAKNPLLR